MLSFLIMAMQSPGFLVQLLKPKENNRYMTEAGNMLGSTAEDSEPVASDGMIVRYQPPVEEAPKPVLKPVIDSKIPPEFDASSGGMKDFWMNIDFVKALVDDSHIPFAPPDLHDDGAWEKLLLANPFLENGEDGKKDKECPTDSGMEVEVTGSGTHLDKSHNFELLLQNMGNSHYLEIEPIVNGSQLETSENLELLTEQMGHLTSESDHRDEIPKRSALLDFKSTTNFLEFCFLSRDIIQTWNESKDCCSWEGITCDKVKGHVIGLDLSRNCLKANLTTNSSLFRLEKLQSLNLAYNHFSNLSFGFDRWKGLTYLNLSSSRYMDSSLLFDEIFLLSKLVSLDLSYNFGLHLDNIKFQMLVHNLTELRSLILDFVNMSLVVPSSLPNLTSSLEHLSLSFCQLQGNFPSQVFQLTKLVSLDLSLNDGLLLDNIKFQMLVHNLTELRFLNLDFVNMSLVVPSSLLNLTSCLEHLSLKGCSLQGNFPSQFFQLMKLVSLDLSLNYVLLLDNLKFQMPVHNLTELRFLILDDVNMSLVMPSSLLNSTSSLEHLSLSFCDLQGNFPNQVFQLPFLQLLDLSYNSHLGGNLPESNQSSTLESLILANTNFSGELPHSIGNLKLLKELNLGSCQFYGSIPRSLANLTKITQLDFDSNLLQGKIPDVFEKMHKLTYLSFFHNSFDGEIPTSMLNLTHLTHLKLSSNKLLGPVPSWLFSLPSLSHLDLQNNCLTGPIDHVKMPNLILQEVYLSNNMISGSIPSSFFDLVNLTIVDLSSNNLTGTITLDMLSRLVDLEDLDLSNNSLLSLSNNGTAVNYSFPNLRSLKFSSCNIHKFPSFLRKAEKLQELDISKNKISGQIHKWEIEGMSLSSLNLSYNFLTGIDSFGFENLETIDLRSNLLQGSLPSLSTTWDSMRNLFISGNNLTSEIPSSYCNFTFLRVLVLANNSLGGKIPKCLGNLSDLNILDLRMNKFHGGIPNLFDKNNSLITLHLNGNQLEGILPRSLVNCSKLEILDVGNNNLNDTFPHWLGVLPSLQVVILRSNRFHGAINNSMPTFYFPQLRIIDIAQNDFMGLLPSNYFKILKGMRDVAPADKVKLGYVGDYIQCLINASCLASIYFYKDSVKVTMKGSERELVRILKIFTNIDFSSNQFHGPIPDELGELNSLLLLNLSHNSLNGQIPSSLGKLAELESLDLSSNKLEGRIPEQLTKLTFLSVLNLSHNELVGHIPEGNQFSTFSNDSYIGNSGLCGFPLTKKCEEPRPPSSQFDGEDDSIAVFEWKFALAGYGCGLVLGLSLGYISFTIGKPWCIVKKVEKYQQKLVARCKQVWLISNSREI
ncbi:hypothetical protein SLEP1_g41702 [Rubroshorea leprosula]|uniref:Leucine-rich repeat-containing N-terminal plant-type domain-containing protein n=1 Tax=Rubroshorea leprosula TaxID=152421 RepID=A0AAV5L7P7_9ROSI|nr:hypothetical protein SLEP1_g41702 [Rubroshorea leprosula]